MLIIIGDDSLGVSVALMVALCTLSCCCLCKVCSNVSEALMLTICVRFRSCLCIVCSNVSEALMLAIRVRFCSCLSKVCSHVSGAFLLALRTFTYREVYRNIECGENGHRTTTVTLLAHVCRGLIRCCKTVHYYLLSKVMGIFDSTVEPHLMDTPQNYTDNSRLSLHSLQYLSNC